MIRRKIRRHRRLFILIIITFITAIIKIIIDWINLDDFTKSLSLYNTWIIIFLGLNNTLSNVPCTIKLSNLSNPLANTSLNAKPNCITAKHNNTSYIVNPLILSNLLNKDIITK